MLGCRHPRAWLGAQRPACCRLFRVAQASLVGIRSLAKRRTRAEYAPKLGFQLCRRCSQPFISLTITPGPAWTTPRIRSPTALEATRRVLFPTSHTLHDLSLGFVSSESDEATTEELRPLTSHRVESTLLLSPSVPILVPNCESRSYCNTAFAAQEPPHNQESIRKTRCVRTQHTWRLPAHFPCSSRVKLTGTCCRTERTEDPSSACSAFTIATAIASLHNCGSITFRLNYGTKSCSRSLLPWRFLGSQHPLRSTTAFGLARSSIAL